jgi:hypothetical protein
MNVAFTLTYTSPVNSRVRSSASTTGGEGLLFVVLTLTSNYKLQFLIIRL